MLSKIAGLSTTTASTGSVQRHPVALAAVVNTVGEAGFVFAACSGQFVVSSNPYIHGSYVLILKG